MKPSSASLYLLLLAPQLIHGQDSQPECRNWTKPIYDYNRALQPAEDAYLSAMIAKIEDGCFDANGVAIPCSIESASNIPEAATYETECYNGGGRIWTYTYSPLCGDVSSTSETSVKPVLVCASASCASVGASNLVPQSELKELKNNSCASGVTDLEMKDPPELVNEGNGISQPECYNWTQAQLFDTNPNMKPAEDAYLEMVALKMQAECIDTASNTAKACDIDLSEDHETAKSYKEECEKGGGVVISYTLNPKCDPGGQPEMKVAPMLVCSSASCYTEGQANLYPRQEETYKYMDEAGINCGSGIPTSETEVVSTPSSGTNLPVVGSLLGATLLAIIARFV
ncbi:expressed unknown protein [Seminavis robusta]|uniref:Uncharacterized protein n=1 Tax=Seminavis robusta TaxID=568900 RepID=A0A9N8H638_9STRA|nr:expressed unknown protein [Seminavis robusta]|eukprot:Sro102_g051970.1 n/a (342) ;mRNA; r:37864-38889